MEQLYVLNRSNWLKVLYKSHTLCFVLDIISHNTLFAGLKRTRMTLRREIEKLSEWIIYVQCIFLLSSMYSYLSSHDLEVHFSIFTWCMKKSHYHSFKMARYGWANGFQPWSSAPPSRIYRIYSLYRTPDSNHQLVSVFIRKINKHTTKAFFQF